MKTRKESDSVGTLDIPAEAYYGVQTLRGRENFQITHVAVNKKLVKNVTLIKKAAAKVNGRYCFVQKSIADAIVIACDEVLEGKLDDHFITDSIQGGAGTSLNMNVNEVVANRATEILGGKKGEYLCHPNDHVNLSQSTNDVIPTAGKLTVLDLSQDLLSAVNALIDALLYKGKQFNDVIKMGRTQLQDAVPIRLGQEFKAYASAIMRDKKRISLALEEMHVINLGGTAIGTCLNANKEYCNDVIPQLAEESGYKLTKAKDLIESTQNADCYVSVSSALKALAVTLSKMSNDLRLMSSGPKAGLGEIVLPAKQNGSSIMPGKINPVIPEVVSQVAFMVMGNDVTVTMAAEGGQLELNPFEPVIFFKLFESLTCLTNAINTLTQNCILGITANREHCARTVDSSAGIVTALCPYLGYKKCAELAKEALATGKSIKELVTEKKLLDESLLDKALDPFLMT